MPLPPNYAEMLKAWQEKNAKACAAAQAKADAWMKDDLLARSKGATPEQVEARKRVARLFCEMHFPADTPAARDARLAPIDYTQPISPANGRTVDTSNPKAPPGFLRNWPQTRLSRLRAISPEKARRSDLCVAIYPGEKLICFRPSLHPSDKDFPMPPAARVTDNHVCPMVTVLVPHVGGPISTPGGPTVTIGGMPAACVGSVCVCVGPPDTIVKGSATVTICGVPAARMGDSACPRRHHRARRATVMIGG